jgi:ribosomal protein S19
MKEQEPSISKVQAKLTREPHPNRLEEKGIFMPAAPGTGGPELPQLSPVGQEATEHLENAARRAQRREPAPPTMQDAAVSPAQLLAARRAWAEANVGRTDLTAEERQTQEQFARMGLGPMPDETPVEKLEREQVGSSLRMYFEQRDITLIRENPMKWLDEKFDRVYQYVKAGNELASPQINQLQQMFSIGANHLSTYGSDIPGITPEIIEEFIETFNTRLNIIFTRSAIEHKNMESVKQAVERLQSHGLLTALGMEHGNVNFMFARIGEKLEDARLAQDKLMQELSQPNISETRREQIRDEAARLHVSPEMMSNLQDNLIDEQVELAVRGVGPYVQAYEDAMAEVLNRVDQSGEAASAIQARTLVRNEITRAVRMAYDAFVVSQRQAILVARGHNLAGLPGKSADAFQSDPSSLFNMFNLEDLLTEKFGLFNKQSHAFLDQIKLDIAKSKLGERAKGFSDEELLDYGTRIFRDLWAAPDLFSSGWRIDYFLKKIEENVDERNRNNPDNQVDESDLGLFMRLKRLGGPQYTKEGDTAARVAEKEGQRADLTKAWGKIAEIRPEEIIRLFRERGMTNPEMVAKLNEFFSGSEFNGVRVYKTDANHNPTTEMDGFKTYDKFKQEFGAVTQLLRQNGYKDMRALRIGRDGFSAGEKELIAKYFKGDASRVGQLQRMFAHFSEIAGRQDTINALMSDKFEDIYTRTLLVDDALLDILDKKGSEGKITPLSDTWRPGSEVAQDPFVRNFNDLEHFAKAAGQLVGFIYTEDAKKRLEAAQTFAEEVSNYNGQPGRSECLRYTEGTYLEISKIPFFWDALSIGKLPFRRTMTKIEEIYGPHAETKSRGDLRQELDIMRSQISPEAYAELSHRLEVGGLDTAKLRSLSLLFFLVFSVFLEGYVVLDAKGLVGKK